MQYHDQVYQVLDQDQDHMREAVGRAMGPVTHAGHAHTDRNEEHARRRSGTKKGSRMQNVVGNKLS